jgi:hypothetical protein
MTAMKIDDVNVPKQFFFFSVPWIGTSWKRAISLFLSLCFSLYFFSSGINLDLRYTFVFSASSTTYGLGILIFPS